MTSYNIGKNNPNFGKKHSSEWIRLMRNNRLGENNPNWVGDKIGYIGVHGYINRNYPKPELCQDCKKRKAYDLANMTGIYSRELKNWKWLCRRCHMQRDGRMNNLKNQEREYER